MLLSLDQGFTPVRRCIQFNSYSKKGHVPCRALCLGADTCNRQGPHITTEVVSDLVYTTLALKKPWNNGVSKCIIKQGHIK